MVSRTETAAATRQALLDAAGALLDLGGPEAVTLREVGARAGVSRSAPYRHFRDKEQLLTTLATAAWSEVGDALQQLVSDTALPAQQSLQRSLMAMITIGRSRPHLYRLMFATPNNDPGAVVQAATRTHDLFLKILSGIVGPDQARPFGALLMTTAHGITALEVSGHLSWAKWHATAENLVDLQISLLPGTSGPKGFAPSERSLG